MPIHDAKISYMIYIIFKTRIYNALILDLNFPHRINNIIRQFFFCKKNTTWEESRQRVMYIGCFWLSPFELAHENWAQIGWALSPPPPPAFGPLFTPICDSAHSDDAANRTFSRSSHLKIWLSARSFWDWKYGICVRRARWFIAASFRVLQNLGHRKSGLK